MALSGSFSSSKYEYDDTTSPTHIEVTWSATQSIANNTSTITWNCYARNAHGDPNGWYYVMAGPVVVRINGTTVLNKTDRFAMYSNALLGSGTITVNHNSDGTKSVAVSISAAIYTYATSSSYSGTITLDKIPRYATSNQSLNSKTETTITMNWSSDSTVDYIWHSKDNGSNWTGVDVTDGKSGTYTISGLSANTAYNIKTRVRRKDSQLTTDSSALNVTTYNYPYCNSAPDFTIGNAVKIGFYNPLSRNLKWEVIGADNSIIATDNTAATYYTGINGTTSVANLYKSIPNAKNGTYKVRVTYGSSISTITGGKYSIKGTEIPTINTFNYIDNNASTVAITGNNQHIVQNKSTLLARFTAATPNNGAGSITKYTVKCNEKTVDGSVQNGANMGAIDSGSNVNLTLTVTDSRGLSVSKTIPVTMLSHSNPTAIVTLKRLNNYEDESYLTVDGAVSSVNGKNTMTIKYRYKESGGNYGSFVTIVDKAKQTLSLDKNKIYVFNVVVTDAFGSTYNKEHTLGKGVFPLFIDTARNSVGINCFPTKNNSLEVNGANLAGRYKLEEQQIGFWVDEKPLYMKVFYVASPKVTTNGTYAYATYDTSDLNIDFGFIKGAYLKDTNYTFTLPYTNSMGNIIKVYYDRTNQKIEIASNITTYSEQYCYIILCFTKKTS